MRAWGRWVRTLALVALGLLVVELHGADVGEELTKVSEIKLLTPQEAAAGRPVRVRGIITVALGGRNGSFLQDETGGVFVSPRKKGVSAFVRVGDWVECRGRTAAGQYAPMVELEQFEYIGRKPIPEPVPVSLGEFPAGRHDAEWVEASGIVRVLHRPTTDSRPELQVTSGRERLRVQICDVRGNVPENLVDAEVSLAGAASGYFNQDRQLLAPVLFVPDWSHVRVIKRGAGDPFAAPVRSTTSLFRYAPDDRWGHMCTVKGVVTHYLPGKVIFLRDEEGTLYAETSQSTPLKPGDRIEVAGFPAIALGGAYLQDSVHRIVGGGPAPEPVATTAAAIVLGKARPSELVSLDGLLVDSTSLRDRWLLTLKSAEHTFDVDLETPAASPGVGLPERGSELRITGVVWAEGVDPRTRNIVPKSFRVLARTPGDIAVVVRAPWWTHERLTRIVLSLLVVVAAGLVWIWLLRRRVEAQTATIAEKVAREAVADERARTACEIHDTMAQGYMALGFQLEALSSELKDSPNPVRQQLDRAIKMLRHSHDEVRLSLKHLRSPVLEQRGLSSALRETMQRGLVGLAPANIRYAEHGTPFPLPPVTEHNILRIGQEAATNAAKHAGECSVAVELTYGDNDVTLRVADDGCGFAGMSSIANGGEHFGLQIMRDRAQRIGGSLQIDSRPGAGTRVILTVPRARASQLKPDHRLAHVEK